MLTFIQFLEEIENNRQVVVIPGDEVARLVQRFGSKVRGMGVWNKTIDGSVEVPMNNITETAATLENRVLADAVEQLKSPEQFASMLNSLSAADQLIDALSRLNLQQFQRRVERYQQSNDPAEVDRLRDEISRELFGD